MLHLPTAYVYQPPISPIPISFIPLPISPPPSELPHLSAFLQVKLDPEAQAPELLEHLFRRGAALLLSSIPAVTAAGSAAAAAALAVPQDEAQATHAAKVRFTIPSCL
jgi:hypothetical protein